MNIDGMGEAMVTQLTSVGWSKNVADIYELTKERSAQPGALRREVGAKYSRMKSRNRRSCRWNA